MFAEFGNTESFRFISGANLKQMDNKCGGD